MLIWWTCRWSPPPLRPMRRSCRFRHTTRDHGQLNYQPKSGIRRDDNLGPIDRPAPRIGRDEWKAGEHRNENEEGAGGQGGRSRRPEDEDRWPTRSPSWMENLPGWTREWTPVACSARSSTPRISLYRMLVGKVHLGVQRDSVEFPWELDGVAAFVRQKSDYYSEHYFAGNMAWRVRAQIYQTSSDKHLSVSSILEVLYFEILKFWNILDSQLSACHHALRYLVRKS